MKQFRVNSKMRHAILGFITNNVVSRNDRAKFEKIFMDLDTDQDGSLTREEIKNGLKNFESGIDGGDFMNEEDIDNFLDLADVNKDGEISQNEFLNAAMGFEQLTSEQNLKGAFKLFDEDGDDQISPKELAQTLSFVDGMSLEKAQKIVSTYDKNGDGYL